MTTPKTKEKCSACQRWPVEGCSRVLCPCRKTLTAAAPEKSGDFDRDYLSMDTFRVGRTELSDEQ